MEDDIEYPSHFSNVISSAVGIFEDYGWYILLSLVLLIYVYQKLLKSAIDEYQEKKDEAEYSAKYHKNPDLLSERLIAQEKRTLKLQEKYNKDAEEYQKKIQEREARKREEILEKFGNESGHRLGPSADDKTKKSFKPEYSPLMGGGSSSNYRPPRRSACSRGGCG
ncbi:selenoprotein S [Leptinotarsa decemlineata]|uniref:selenoprotein S n=1 Tax=Leptinotarsa decemlineata TaxID=7539 RepID=UPI000C2557F7|nr:uncharacterized protein LOC111509388 [Leptinotarsa decemlineata]